MHYEWVIKTELTNIKYKILFNILQKLKQHDDKNEHETNTACERVRKYSDQAITWINEIYSDSLFKGSPKAYVKEWQSDRGDDKNFRILEDTILNELVIEYCK